MFWMLKNIKNVSEKDRSKFIGICKNIYQTMFSDYRWHSLASGLINADKTDYGSLPFFRIVFSIKDLGLHFSVKPINKSQRIISELVKIYTNKWNDSYTANKKAVEIVAMYWLACQKVTQWGQSPYEVICSKEK